MLASGGNALDAAIATNLTLGVVTPYLCGFGGDLFAMIWTDGRLFAYNGSGRAPAAATAESVRAVLGGDRMPTFGPHTVTVPGAVEAWFVLLEHFGTRAFSDLARNALTYAREGFTPSPVGLASLNRSAARYAWSPEWRAVYGRVEPDRPLVQQDLARTYAAYCLHATLEGVLGIKPPARGIRWRPRIRTSTAELWTRPSHNEDSARACVACHRCLSQMRPSTLGL